MRGERSNTTPAVTERDVQHLRDEVRTSLLAHIWGVHGFDPPRHQRELWIPALEDTSIKRLILVAPPKMGKTPMVGLDYLGWRIGCNPNYHGIYVSNTASQACKPSVALRDTIQSNKTYRWLYGVEPDMAKGWAESEWFVKRSDQSDKDPTLQACGVGGPLLGATVEEVIFDDIADPGNMATAYQREKLIDWMRKVPLSRLIPGVGRVVMITTRWCDDDPVSEFEKDGWQMIVLPAIDCEDAWFHDDVTQRWRLTPAGRAGLTYPEYWTPEAIEERRLDLGTKDFMLMFQGHTMPEGGNIFKHEWWQYYDRLPAHSMIVQAYDTGFKTGRENDYSAQETWAVCDDGFYLIDAWHGKVAFPELKTMLMQAYEQHHPVAILVEDAASGQSLIQEARSKTSLPIIPIKVDRDKISRANAITPILESCRVKLPRQAYWLQEWLYEHEVFPNGAHDDWCFVAGTRIATQYGEKPIETIRAGDYVLTPLGSRRVLSAGKTGRKTVIERIGLTGTHNHKVFSFDSGFVEMDTLTLAMKYDKLSLTGLAKWGYRRLLYSRGKPTGLWGRNDIISASQIQIRGENIPKDFMLRFGNLIMERQFPGAISFTIKITTLLIMISAIWSVYRTANIARDILSEIKKNKLNTLKKLDCWLANGIVPWKVSAGITNMLKKFGLDHLKLLFANSVARNLCREDQVVVKPASVQTIAAINTGVQLDFMISPGNASPVEPYSRPKGQVTSKGLRNIAAENVLDNLVINRNEVDVYNLTVANAHVYYANGILVSNCDCTSMSLNWLRAHEPTGAERPREISKRSLWRDY